MFHIPNDYPLSVFFHHRAVLASVASLRSKSNPITSWVSKLTLFQCRSTVFGLYRDGTELRGVYYSKPEVAREACDSLGTQCDYPILMGASLRYGCILRTLTILPSRERPTLWR